MVDKNELLSYALLYSRTHQIILLHTRSVAFFGRNMEGEAFTTILMVTAYCHSDIPLVKVEKSLVFLAFMVTS